MTEKQGDFLGELKRRKVYRVAIAYVVVAWVALQFFDLALENFNAPDWAMQTIMAVAAIGFPAVLVLAWAFDITKDGIKAAPGMSRAFAVLITIVSLGAVGFAAWTFLGDEARVTAGGETPGGKELRAIDSIAVLPFESFSENQSEKLLVPVQGHQQGCARDRRNPRCCRATRGQRAAPGRPGAGNRAADRYGRRCAHVVGHI